MPRRNRNATAAAVRRNAAKAREQERAWNRELEHLPADFDALPPAAKQATRNVLDSIVHEHPRHATAAQHAQRVLDVLDLPGPGGRPRQQLVQLAPQQTSTTSY